jgi:RHS repeat-associated protein
VRLTLDNNGTAFSGATYDPWGSPERGSVGTFGFTGELQQGDNVYLRARWYNATNGTFTSKDPFEGYPQQPYSLHPYQYGLSDPLRLVDRSGWCAEDEWQQSTASGCYRFYQDALKSIGLDIDKHKALFLKLDINQFLEISQWGARGLRLYEGNWDSNTVWTIIEALDRVQRAVGGNARLLERMFDLDGRFERQLRFSFRYESSSEGTSAGYAPGVMMGFMKRQKSGALIAKVDSEPVTEHLIIHELGHRFDHIAGGDEYWSSGNVWLNAAGWCFSVTSSTYTLTAEGLKGAVSEYAAHGMAGVMGSRAREYLPTLGMDSGAEADYVANAIKGLEGGNPAEDFAETFAWYIFNKTGGKYGLSGGIRNWHNLYDHEPSPARLEALIDLIDTFR